MKINRLLEITIILLNKGTVTAKDLAERFSVSVRTIYRDIDVLSAAGVPVYMSKGRGGGITLLEDYSLNKTLISENESKDLLLALKTLQAIKYPEADTVLEKIGAVFKNVKAADWIHIDFTCWGSTPNENNKFIDIKKSIIENRVISFDYVNAGGGRSSRSIEPVRLIFKGQAWYLWGYCRFRQEFRVFRLSRIKNLCVTNETFKTRDIPDMEEDKNDNALKNFVTLKLRFMPEALWRIYDDFDDGAISKNSDDTYNVTVALPEDEWVYGYIMSYGNYVEVLEPERIKKIVTDRVKKTLELYEK